MTRSCAAPDPGSTAALEGGCRCPRMDNGYGRGCGRVDEGGEPLFWINEECPMHAKRERDDEQG